MTPPLSLLHPLVVAMARMMCRNCADCRGAGLTIGDHGPTEEPCAICGDVRRALAEAEREEGT